MRERYIDSSEHTVYESLTKFQEAQWHPAGVLTVMNRSQPIDIRNEPRGYDTTTVFFHAALTGEKYRFPVFTGAGISEELPTNRVFVSDPSLYLNEKLTLAWYAGNHRQDRLQWVIRGILKALIPAGQRVVTFGASGGGFAALYYSAHLPGSTAVPINPQTNLGKYTQTAVDRYGRLAWGLTGTKLAHSIPATTNLVQLYGKPRQNHVIYVQNRNDKSHTLNHLKPFMAALPEGHAVHPFLVDGEAGHKRPPREVTQSALAAAISGADAP